MLLRVRGNVRDLADAVLIQAHIEKRTGERITEHPEVLRASLRSMQQLWLCRAAKRFRLKSWRASRILSTYYAYTYVATRPQGCSLVLLLFIKEDFAMPDPQGSSTSQKRHRIVKSNQPIDSKWTRVELTDDELKRMQSKSDALEIAALEGHHDHDHPTVADLASKVERNQ